MSPSPCLHVHVSMSMSPCPCLHVHVSMSMSPCPWTWKQTWTWTWTPTQICTYVHNAAIPWFFSSQLPLSQKYINSIQYHKFAPVLEDDPIMWKNLNYVSLNDFMLFNGWGLKKRWKQYPAGYPERNTYWLMPLSTPDKSRRTVALSKVKYHVKHSILGQNVD